MLLLGRLVRCLHLCCLRLRNLQLRSIRTVVMPKLYARWRCTEHGGGVWAC